MKVGLVVPCYIGTFYPEVGVATRNRSDRDTDSEEDLIALRSHSTTVLQNSSPLSAQQSGFPHRKTAQR
jgi:hypothetical protein